MSFCALFTPFSLSPSPPPPPPLLPAPLPGLNSGENSHLPFCLPLTWLRIRVLASRVDLLCRWFPSSSAPIYFSLVLWFFLLLLVGEFYQSLKLSSVTLSTYSSLFLPFVCLSFSLKKVFILFIFVYIYFFNPWPEGLFTSYAEIYIKACVLFPATECFIRSPSQEVQNSTRKRTFKVQAPANGGFYHYDRCDR